MLSKKGTREAFSLTVLHPDTDNTEKLINHKHAWLYTADMIFI